MTGGWARFWRRRFICLFSLADMDVPWGIRVVRRFTTPSKCSYKVSVLVITYIAYMCYHLTRKPISVVKAVLRNCTKSHDDATFSTLADDPHCGYPPFDGPNSDILFAALDWSFLFSYAIAMFAAGLIAERVSLRYFLSFGMLLSGIFCYLFGVAKSAQIHSIWYFVFVQTMAGICQTTGWPGVVTVVGRWFGKSKRGLIFGIWNSHTSIGNILGTLLPAYYVMSDWSKSFMMPGLIMGIAGFFVFLFLVDSPEIVNCQEPPTLSSTSRRYTDPRRLENQTDSDGTEPDSADIVIGEQRFYNNGMHNEVMSRASISERTPILAINNQPSHNSEHAAIGFVGALKIPGVVEFSLCLFFTKLVSYTFLFWLPMYITSSTDLGPEGSAKLATVFDYGGIIGAIAAGVLSDYSSMPATTCSGMLAAAIPALLIYKQWGTSSIVLNYFLLFVTGLLVNGPYSLITTSVSAELGQHSSLEGNNKALATVTAIIDGTGSFGAAVGPFLAGMISGNSWNNVFYMVSLSEVFALLLLVRLIKKEFDTRNRRNVRIE